MTATFAALCVVIGALSGCGQTGTPTAVASGSASAAPTGPTDPHARLTALAAAAKDRRFIAGYTLSRPSQHNKTVTVAVATDGTWRIDIQGGALGGGTDIALVGIADGQYQCTLNAAPGNEGCVKVAASRRKLPAAVDPQVQYPFTSWLDVLTDPSVAVAVTVVAPLANTTGTCFAVEPTTVTTTAPIPSSTFCYTDDGTLTGVRAAFGTMVISGAPAAAPASTSLPGQVVSRAALPTAAPAAPPVVSGSAKASPTGTTPSGRKS
jgi:hypothetical protein